MQTVAAAAVCGLLALGVSACGDGENALTEVTLKFDERDSDDFGLVDNPPKAQVGPEGPRMLSIGDQLVFRTVMLDGQEEVGDLNATCVVTAPGGEGNLAEVSSTCQATVNLPGGQLFLGVGGKAFASSTTRGAITGGTGEYEGATGTFSSAGETDARDTFHFYLPEK